MKKLRVFAFASLPMAIASCAPACAPTMRDPDPPTVNADAPWSILPPGATYTGSCIDMSRVHMNRVVYRPVNFLGTIIGAYYDGKLFATAPAGSDCLKPTNI